MEEVLLVDGYNMINAWPDLRKKVLDDHLNDARKELIEILQDYQGYKGSRIIVVFDAHMMKGGIEKNEEEGGVEVIYTRENETADHYIERWVDGQNKNQKIRVATSDFLQQTIVLSRGATRISARELLEDIQSAHKEMKTEYLEKIKAKTNTLDSWASPEVKQILERWRRQR